MTGSLGRLPEFDERSRHFAVRSSLGSLGITTATPNPTKQWFFGGAPWRSRGNLDQGSEGACVGFGWTQELITSPVVKRFSTFDQANGYALGVYHAAQKIDQWPGEDYDGTSVIAGAKVMKARGYIPEYRWAFGIDDLVQAVSHLGPVVVGTNWHEGMDSWDDDGVLTVEGDIRGGHCYLVRGFIAGSVPYLRITNSWGENWGLSGDAFIRVRDFAILLASGGEACIPMRRESL